MAEDPQAESVAFRFDYPDREEWREWADALPRSISLDERIRELIDKDREMLTAEVDDISEASLEVMAQRIKIRSTQARGAVREGEVEQAEAILDDIHQIAGLLDQ